MTRFKRIVVHHTAGPRSQTLEDIRDFHVNVRGWSDVGYHFVIEEDGRVRKGRDWRKVPACVKGKNGDSLCTAVTGDNTDPEESWNDIQRASLQAHLDTLVGLLGVPVDGHRDHSNTACPGLEVEDYYKQ